MTIQQIAATPDIATDEGQSKSRFANGHLIWQTIVDLHNRELRISRRAIAEITGIKPGIVDDHVERWVEKDQLRKIGNGELQLVQQFPATRPIFKSSLPNGLVKVEVGSDLLELTPAEARILARDLAGHAAELTDIEASHKLAARLHELSRELRTAYREIAALRAHVKMAEPPPQQAAIDF